MFYTIYKTTNLINGKIYIGCHTTSNLDDKYLGSGTILKQSIKKYGTKNFKREWLALFDNPEDMFAMEAELVNEDFIKLDNNYNIILGGDGGFNHIHNHPNATEWRRKGREAANLVLKEKYGDDWKHKMALLASEAAITPEVISKRKNTMLLRYGEDAYKTFSGKSHSEESKRKIGEANKLNIGEKNSQYGTMWITNKIENKKIKKTDVIPDGWIPGRKMKVHPK